MTAGRGAARPGLPPGLRAIAESYAEADLERKVRGALKDLEDAGHGVLAYHPWSSKNSAGGWPDWVFCGPGGFMARELKREREGPRADQERWLAALRAAGADADAWRPSDWLSGRVTRELAAIAGLRIAGALP